MRFQVTRVDGFKFWVKVTIPRDYGQKLPALFWFYPREYTSQQAYDQRSRAPSPKTFPSLRTRTMQVEAASPIFSASALLDIRAFFRK